MKTLRRRRRARGASPPLRRLPASGRSCRHAVDGWSWPCLCTWRIASYVPVTSPKFHCEYPACIRKLRSNRPDGGRRDFHTRPFRRSDRHGTSRSGRCSCGLQPGYVNCFSDYRLSQLSLYRDKQWRSVDSQWRQRTKLCKRTCGGRLSDVHAEATGRRPARRHTTETESDRSNRGPVAPSPGSESLRRSLESRVAKTRGTYPLAAAASACGGAMPTVLHKKSYRT